MDTLRKLELEIKNRDSKDEVVEYLIDNVKLRELADGLASALFELNKRKERTPIRISQSDFDKHFRIIGFKADGTPEQRGSNRWKKED